MKEKSKQLAWYYLVLGDIGNNGSLYYTYVVEKGILCASL